MPFLLLGLFFLAATAVSGEPTPCSNFKAQVDATYGFRPSLIDKKTQDEKALQMDAVWEAVKKNFEVLAPCLEAELDQRPEDSWFHFDAGQLLVAVEPSRKSKGRLLEGMKKVFLEDVHLGTWVRIAVQLGKEDFDSSELGRRWLDYPKARYSLPQHAAEIDRGTGALFIFGAMDERYATPVLLESTRSESGEVKEIAAWLLMSQATPESLEHLEKLDLADFSERARNRRRDILANPAPIVPRESPKITRQDFRAAFQAVIEGNLEPFGNLVDQVPDGERDLVAVCTDDDIELIRKVRRHLISRANPHVVDFYYDFAKILMTLISRAPPAPATAPDADPVDRD